MNWVSRGRVINTCCSVLLIGENKWMFAKHIRSEKTQLPHWSGWSAGWPRVSSVVCVCLAVFERWCSLLMMCVYVRVCAVLHVCAILFQCLSQFVHVHLTTHPGLAPEPCTVSTCLWSHTHTLSVHLIFAKTPQVASTLYVGRTVSRGHCSSMSDRCSWGQQQHPV